MMGTSLVVAALLLGGVSPPSATLDAREWWNLRSLHAPDQRTYVVLLFSTRNEARVKPLLGRLHHLDKRPDVLVVGLSPDSTQRVKPFIDKHKITFLVGAGSRAPFRLGVRGWPQLMVLWPGLKPGSRMQVFQVDQTGLAKLESLLKANARAATQNQPLPPADSLDDKTPMEVLRRAAIEGDTNARYYALKLLRKKLTPRATMSLCDEMLAAGPPADMSGYYMKRAIWRGGVEYLRHSVDPAVTKKQPFLSAGDTARENLEPVDDALLLVYKGSIAKKSPAELEDTYLKHASHAPVDLVIRQEVLARIEDGMKDRRQALDIVMRLIPDEPDTYLRWMLVGALGNICEHDADSDHSDVAAFLEDMLETETDIRRVRPMILGVLEYLYTGE